MRFFGKSGAYINELYGIIKQKMARGQIYISKEVKEKIKEYLNYKYQIALDGYYSANEDEDTLIGDLIENFRIKDREVKVNDNKISGVYTWSISYAKFRGRGNDVPEKFIGIDA